LSLNTFDLAGRCELGLEYCEKTLNRSSTLAENLAPCGASCFCTNVVYPGIAEPVLLQCE
jgi:hypothetical protein